MRYVDELLAVYPGKDVPTPRFLLAPLAGEPLDRRTGNLKNMKSALDDLGSKVSPVLARMPGVTYVILFGSVARGQDHAWSDVDLAVGGRLAVGDRLSLERDLELALGRPTQLVSVAGAPPALRARIFREGIVLWEHDREARVRDHTRAIVDYLDYQGLESLYLSRVRARALGGSQDGR